MERAELLQRVLSAGSAALTFGGDKIGGYYLHQEPEEYTDFVLYCLGREYRSLLEIGCACGGNARFLSEVLGLERVVLVDDNSLGETAKLRVDVLRGFGRVEIIGDCGGEPVYQSVRNLSPRMYDIVFIDADHSAPHPYLDFCAFSEFVSPRGCVVFHDSASETGVVDAVDIVSQFSNWQKVLVTRGRFGITVFERKPG